MTSVQYSVAVTHNPFELFDSDDAEEADPLEILQKIVREKEAKKKAAAAAPSPAVASQNSKTAAPTSGEPKRKTMKHNESGGQKGGATGGGGPMKENVRPNDRPSRNTEANDGKPRPKTQRKNQEFTDEDDSRFEGRSGNRNSDGRSFRGRTWSRGGGGVGSGGERGGGRSGGGRFAGNDQYSRGGPKREYDRQSGSDKTGVKAVGKRDGSGAHNWGNPKDDVWDEREQAFDESPIEPASEGDWNDGPVLIDKANDDNGVEIKIDEQPAEQGSTQPDANQTENNEETAEEKARKELTLDEWRALKAPRNKPVYNIRKPGEGEDPTQWKKMFVLDKKKETEEDDEDEYINLAIPQRVGRLKRVSVDFRFADNRRSGGDSFRGRGRGGPRDSERGGGGRGGRGGGRPSGGGGRGEGNVAEHRHETSAPAAPKVDDERDFPSL